MKKAVIIFFGLFIFTGGCSSDGPYKKTINAYLHKAFPAFTVTEIKVTDIQKITVADSIEIVKEVFNEKREMLYFMHRDLLEKNRKSLLEEESEPNPSQVMITFHRQIIEEETRYIDSLEKLSPLGLQRYEKRDPGEVLSIIVKCEYSLSTGKSKREKSMTSDFLLSADGTTCYGIRIVK